MQPCREGRGAGVPPGVDGRVPGAVDHRPPIAVVVELALIGGLAIATVITLLLVPVFYAITVKDLKLVRWEA